MSIHIHHITETQFDTACRAAVKADSRLSYEPASWDAADYPDVGFASLTDGVTRITWGHNFYSHDPETGELTSEECITVCPFKNDKISTWEQSVIETPEQLNELIRKTFYKTSKDIKP